MSALKRTLDLPSGGDPLASAAILGRPDIQPRTLCRSSSSTWLPIGDDDQKIFIFHNGKKVLGISLIHLVNLQLRALFGELS